MGFGGQSILDLRKSINVTSSISSRIFITLFFSLPREVDLVLDCGTADQKREMSWLGSCTICSLKRAR
jgi:hypothetical protein